MSAIFLHDDARARAFEPFALTRPLGELRAGALLIRERWERALGTRAAGFLGAAHLDGFEEPGAAPRAEGVLPAGAIVASTRCVVALASADAGADVWTCDGEVAAVRLREPVPASAFADGTLTLADLAPVAASAASVHGRWLREVWDLIGQLPAQLAEDTAALGPTLDCVEQHPGLVLGDRPVYVERGATVEPYTVFDTSAGAVVVRRGAHVHAFTRVVGPCYVGEGSSVAGDKIAACAIGDTCRVHGEISTSIVLGHANKSHDGFVGHSYFGRWVNLGAGTTTSNLKNTYGTVALATPDGVRDTGLQFLGTLFGDHAKTGIGLRLTTGCVIGAGANVYDRMPPKATPPFAWGGGAPYGSYALDRFLVVAERAMARRQVPLGDGARAVLRAAHARAAAMPGAAEG